VIVLKPCPFCGGEAYFDKDDHGWQWIECGKCHVATNQRASLMEDCKPLLAEAWNTRRAIDSDATRSDALKKAADRAVAWQVSLCKRDDWHCECCTECSQLRYAILGTDLAHSDGEPEYKREYILDRYRDGMRMAEGARVTASSLEEAIEKARHLPGYPRFTHDTFRERQIEKPKSIESIL